MKHKFQIIKLDIASASAQVPFEVNTKKEHEKIVGVGFFSADVPHIDSRIQLTINNEEIFPDGFPASFFLQKAHTSWNELKHKIDEKADFSIAEGTYKDGGTTGAPYEMYIILEAIEKEKNE